MKYNKKLKIYTSSASPENISSAIEKNLIPIFIIENMSKIGYLSKYDCGPAHCQILAPSPRLLWEYRSGKIDFDTYIKKYVIDLAQLNFTKILSRLSSMVKIFNASGVVLFGYDPDYNKCYRKPLAEILNMSGLLENEIKEI